MSTSSATPSPPSLPEPILRRKLGEEVLGRLLERIRSGQWPMDTQLPSERDLMTTFAVGRPAIREALQALERMGLIAITHGERARVVAPTADSVLQQVGDTARRVLETSPGTLDHLKQARLMFEVSMVRIAAQRATAADIRRIEAALEAHRAAIQEVPLFLKRDMEFHRTIAAMTGNPIFAVVSQSMFEWLESFHVNLVRAPGAEQLTLAEHARILKAIAARNPEAAARAMTAHLTRTNKLYRLLESPDATTGSSPPKRAKKRL